MLICVIGIETPNVEFQAKIATLCKEGCLKGQIDDRCDVSNIMVHNGIEKHNFDALLSR